jgi:hypothetical protein
MTQLTHVRGTDFEKSFTLSNGWTGSTFTGGVYMTIRRSVPASTVNDDTDDGVIDTASTATGEITFDGAVGTILIPAARTKTWPTGKLRADLKGAFLSGAVEPIDPEIEIAVRGDITRRIPPTP